MLHHARRGLQEHFNILRILEFVKEAMIPSQEHAICTIVVW